jgi:hypothetical protein
MGQSQSIDACCDPIALPVEPQGRAHPAWQYQQHQHQHQHQHPQQHPDWLKQQHQQWGSEEQLRRRLAAAEAHIHELRLAAAQVRLFELQRQQPRAGAAEDTTPIATARAAHPELGNCFQHSLIGPPRVHWPQHSAHSKARAPQEAAATRAPASQVTSHTSPGARHSDRPPALTACVGFNFGLPDEVVILDGSIDNSTARCSSSDSEPDPILLAFAHGRDNSDLLLHRSQSLANGTQRSLCKEAAQEPPHSTAQPRRKASCLPAVVIGRHR